MVGIALLVVVFVISCPIALIALIYKSSGVAALGSASSHRRFARRSHTTRVRGAHAACENPVPNHVTIWTTGMDARRYIAS